MSVKNWRKRSGFLIYSYSILKTMHLLQLKGMQSSRSVKGLPLVNRRYTKEVAFSDLNVGKGLDLGAWPPRIKLCLVPPGLQHFKRVCTGNSCQFLPLKRFRQWLSDNHKCRGGHFTLYYYPWVDMILLLPGVRLMKTGLRPHSIEDQYRRI